MVQSIRKVNLPVITLLFLLLLSQQSYSQDVLPTPSPSPSSIPFQRDITSIITPSGLITEDVRLSSPDEYALMVIPEGTRLLDIHGEPLSHVELRSLDSPPVDIPGVDIGSIAYSFGPEGASLDPPTTLTIKYNAKAFIESVLEEELVIVRLDQKTEEWIDVSESIVDTDNKLVSIDIDQLHTFAIRGNLSPPVPFNPWLILVIILWLLGTFGLLTYMNIRKKRRQQ